MSASPELDDATRAKLRWEAERLAAEQGMSLLEAKRIVWADYLDELAAYAPAPAAAETDPPQPLPSPPETPVPEPPPVAPKPVTKPAAEPPFFTPERLQSNRDELAKVKRLIGLRS